MCNGPHLLQPRSPAPTTPPPHCCCPYLTLWLLLLLRLLALCAGGVYVVMQMPRGNLETVAPRALLLTAVVDALARHDYARAWALATINRVDLNLIVDYSWPSFLVHARDFVVAVPR